MVQFDNKSPTARALLVLQRESRRAREASERVDLVVRALAMRWGAAEPELSRTDFADADLTG